jgi:hypothetical protein
MHLREQQHNISLNCKLVVSSEAVYYYYTTNSTTAICELSVDPTTKTWNLFMLPRCNFCKDENVAGSSRDLKRLNDVLSNVPIKVQNMPSTISYLFSLSGPSPNKEPLTTVGTNQGRNRSSKKTEASTAKDCNK